MTTRARLQILLLVAALACAVSLVGAQEQAAIVQAQRQAASLGLADPMPVDAPITVGRLSNGLRYYVRANNRPEKRAELRLAVNAGSVLEDDDQLGLAHMVEHMAFNGTRRFEKQEIVRFMESIGMRSGPNLNGNTSVDETVYTLVVPTDRPDVLDRAFLILEEWATNLAFDPEDIDRERGVVIEEWRLERGAGARARDRHLPILFKGSRYAERLPIGTRESIETFGHEALRRFYADWYRPDLMAVVAVGDFDPRVVEQLIRRHFGAIPAARRSRPRPTFDVPDHPATLYSIATDREATNTEIAIYNKLPLRPQGTVGVYRQHMVERLAASMLGSRLIDLTAQPDAPFVMAAAGRSIFVRSKEAATLSAVPKEGAVERALEVLLTEAMRAARFGFTATELERHKVERLRSYERYFAEKDTHESAALADEYVRNFTLDETLPGAALEYALHQRYLPEITLEEVNRAAKDWTGDRSRVVMIVAPEKPGLAPPDEARLAAVVERVGRKALDAHVDAVAGKALLDRPVEPGRIVGTSRQELAGITEWTLSNGARVVLKPTSYQQDDVVFRATSPGGHSLASDRDFVPAMTAAQVISPAVTGLGHLSAVDLRKVLAGKVASVTPFIDEIEEGLSGSGSTKDLETLFQLIYVAFTAPRADAAAFVAHVAQGKAILANRQASPAWAFSEALESILSQDHPRARPLTVELLDQMNLERSLAFYQDRFADASDFTFVFVGSFDVESMRPLVERYLASLPTLPRKETWRDVGIRPPASRVEKVVRKGIEPQSEAAVVFTGPFSFDEDHRVAIRALGVVLSSVLNGMLRQNLGGTYDVMVNPTFSKSPQERYLFPIAFGCSPDRVEELVRVVFRAIEALKARVLSDTEIAELRQSLLRNDEANLTKNSYLLEQIVLRYRAGEDVNGLFTLADRYSRLTGQAVRDAARAYLDTNRVVVVTLYPEQPPRKK